jgi:predicted membrane metal-binding protein
MLLHFNQLSLAGVLANLVVVPLSAAATTLGLLALALSVLSDLAAAALFNFVWLVVVLLKISVWVAACLPWAMVSAPMVEVGRTPK